MGGNGSYDKNTGGVPFANWRTMWDTIKIDGKSLEEVIQRSYIIYLTL